MELDTIIFGDNHCDFTAVEDAAREIDPASPPLCVFVGDFGFADKDDSNWEPGTSRHGLPFRETRKPDEILRPLTDLGCRILHVRGNHDFEDADQYGAVIGSKALRGGNLHCRVVEIEGVRIAGLEGIFGGPWLPKDDHVVSHTREHWLATNRSYKNGSYWRHTLEKQWGVPEGLQVGHRKYIFPEDADRLRTMEADVLVTHEAPLSPGCDKGFQVINDIASEIGAKAVIHGHIHEGYEAETSEGIMVHSIHIRSWVRLDLGQYRIDRRLAACA
jgi:Icc-related predicted phosphoesterase